MHRKWDKITAKTTWLIFKWTPASSLLGAFLKWMQPLHIFLYINLKGNLSTFQSTLYFYTYTSGVSHIFPDSPLGRAINSTADKKGHLLSNEMDMFPFWRAVICTLAGNSLRLAVITATWYTVLEFYLPYDNLPCDLWMQSKLTNHLFWREPRNHPKSPLKARCRRFSSI